MKNSRRMVQAVIQLGGNEAATLEKMHAFPDWAEKNLGRVTGISRVYRTSPWGMEGVADFLNQVLRVNTGLAVEELMDQLLAYETFCGRIRENKSGYSSRILDADLLFYGDACIQSEKVEVPHPRMHLRRFSLIPSIELLPGYVHPRLKKSLEELLKNCPDNGEVYIFGHG